MTNYESRPMTTLDWFITLFILSVPLVNVVVFILWVFGLGNRNRVSYCRAMLLWMIVVAAIYFLFFSMGISLTYLSGAQS